MFTRLRKRVLAGVIVVTALVMMLAVPVAAEDKYYEIPSVDFYVSFDEKGNAYVTEEWNVVYHGSYTRLYKDIHYAGLPVMEQFDDVLITQASINGVSVDYSESPEERTPNTYCFTKDSENYTIQWNHPATDEMVNYSVSYIVKNVVTVTDENRAIFCYRFIGNNFEHSIESSTIHYINPTDSDMIVKFSNRSMDESRNGGELVLFTDSYTGLCKVNINMDGSFFTEAGKRVEAATVAAEEKKDADDAFLDDLMFGGICALCSFGGIGAFVWLIVAIAKDKKLKKRAKDSQEVWQAVQLLQRERISPTYVLMRYRDTSGICYSKMFLSQILYLVLAGYIGYEKEEDRLVFLGDNQIGIPIADIDMEFFNKLKEVVGKTEISRQDIEENKEYYIDQFRTYFTGYVKKIQVSKETKDAAIIVKYAGMEMNAVGDFDAEHLDYMYIIKQGILHDASEREEYNSLIDQMDYYACCDYAVLRSTESSSSSSGSSCSSCSSCSGCGGGGAD